MRKQCILVSVIEWRRKGQIIEWYRVDGMPHLQKTLGVAAALVGLGVTISGLSWMEARESSSVAAWLSVSRAKWVSFNLQPSVLLLGFVALVCIVAGGLTAIFGLFQDLSKEHYLALCSDGALYVNKGLEYFMPWEELEDIQWHEGDRSLVFIDRKGREVWVREEFVGLSGKELAERLRWFRRRAIFGLL
ncbi:MAG: hypothetical protein RMJ84_08790 [Sandaracinaceae bacterium]|nr:hypothetical protein [Sandaracinaceae bacterium]